MKDNIVCGSLSNAMTIVEKLLLEGYQVLVTPDCGAVYRIDYAKEELGESFEYVDENHYVAEYAEEEGGLPEESGTVYTPCYITRDDVITGVDEEEVYG